MRIGVDLGGTNVRVGLVDEGRIVRLLSEPCRADRSEEEVLGHIASLIEQLMAPGVECIGIGVPSVVDAVRGIVYNVVGIPSWREVHLKERFEERFGIPVHVNNDCNCFALGVCRFGEALGCRDVVCIALGTGVGAGIVIDGKLYSGPNTGAGEIGSIPYLDRDYEYYCSSRFFVGRGTSARRPLSGRCGRSRGAGPVARVRRAHRTACDAGALCLRSRGDRLRRQHLGKPSTSSARRCTSGLRNSPMHGPSNG